MFGAAIVIIKDILPNIFLLTTEAACPNYPVPEDNKPELPILQLAAMVYKNQAMKLTTKALSQKAYLFPLAGFILLLVLTATKISGSSIPIYSMLDGTLEQDRGLVANHPRGVRSDEWLVTTQLTIAQSAADFPKVNQNIAQGQNMSFQDLPYRSWFTVFAPHNLPFLFMPLEYAFAFKWWFIGLLLLLAVYCVCLKLLSGNVILSALIALIVLVSPLVVWWWQSATLLSIAYPLVAVCLAIKILEATSLKARLGLAALLFYCLTCFALILYPPFQIVCALVAFTVLVAWFIDRYPRGQRMQPLRTLLAYLVPAFVLAGLIVVAFYLSNREEIQTILNTVYPGRRVETGGGLGPLNIFGSFLSPLLQSDTRSVGYLRNQSEASSFIFLSTFLVIPCLYVAYRRYKETRQLPWALITVHVALVLFLVRAYFQLDVLQPLARLLLLDKVPTARLPIGIGLLGVFQLVFLIREASRVKIGYRHWRSVGLVTGALGLAVMAWIGHQAAEGFPALLPQASIALMLALSVAGVVLFLAAGRWRLGLVLLLLFSIVSTYRVHPLYSGLGAISESPVVTQIAHYPDDGAWAVLDDRLMINFPLMAGKASVNAVQYYPQLALWREADPAGQYELVYNRFAHVLFSTEIEEPFVMKYTDLILVKFEPCQPFGQRHIKYVLSPTPLGESCLEEREMVGTPVHQFYIYEVQPVGVASSLSP